MWNFLGASVEFGKISMFFPIDSTAPGVVIFPNSLQLEFFPNVPVCVPVPDPSKQRKQAVKCENSAKKHLKTVFISFFRARTRARARARKEKILQVESSSCLKTVLFEHPQATVSQVTL